MKNLEGINSKKFEITEEQMSSIKGGLKEPEASWDSSYNYHYTYQDNSTTMDQTMYDICRDF